MDVREVNYFTFQGEFEDVSNAIERIIFTELF